MGRSEGLAEEAWGSCSCEFGFHGRLKKCEDPTLLFLAISNHRPHPLVTSHSYFAACALGDPSWVQDGDDGSTEEHERRGSDGILGRGRIQVERISTKRSRIERLVLAPGSLMVSVGMRLCLIVTHGFSTTAVVRQIFHAQYRNAQPMVDLIGPSVRTGNGEW